MDKKFVYQTGNNKEVVFAASGLYTHVVTGRCPGWGGTVEFPLSLDNGRSPHGYINQRLKIQFRAPDDERCAVRNMLSLQ